MPFTVTYDDAGIKRHEFDAYVRLLEKRGIDWTNTPRVPEPGMSNRWLYAWENRADAEDFCEDLRRETRDNKWVVRELSPAARPSSPGPLTAVVILVRRHSLGAEFTLHPHSRILVRRRFPEARLVTSVSIESSTLTDFEQQQGPMWEHIALVLTGLTASQLAQIGGYRIVDPLTDENIFEDALVNLV